MKDRLFYQLWKRSAGKMELERRVVYGTEYKNWEEDTDYGRHPPEDPINMAEVWTDTTFSVGGVPMLRTHFKPGRRPPNAYFYNPEVKWDFNVKAPIDYILPVKRNPGVCVTLRKGRKTKRVWL